MYFKDVLGSCMWRCTFSKDAWRYSTEAVFLDENGLSQICMKRCIGILNGVADETRKAATNAAIVTGKRFLEIAAEETIPGINYGVIAATVAVAAVAVGYLYMRGAD